MGDDSVKTPISAELYQRARFYNELVTHYLMRCYQIHKHGNSDIKEDKDMPLHVKTILQDTVNQPRLKEEDFEKYSAYEAAENRHEQLKTALADEMKNKCSKLAPSEFLSTCAPYIFLAYDLRVSKGFDKALECAIDAMTEATVVSDRAWYLDLWSP